MRSRPRSRSRRRTPRASHGSARNGATTRARRRSMRRMPLEHDMIGLYFAVGNANHLPPWGGLDMLLSTNPIAVAVPAGEEPPIVLDMATTVAAYGKVKTKAQRGETMPEGWMIDREGPAADRSEARGRRLSAADRRLQGLRPRAHHRPAGGHAQTARRWAATSSTSTQTTTAPPIPGRRSSRSTSRRSATSRSSSERRRAGARSARQSERLPGVDRICLPGEQSHATRDGPDARWHSDRSCADARAGPACR